MYSKPIFYFTNFLYRYFFPIYKILYFQYKYKKDNFEINLFRKLIQGGNNVLDIGANIGFYSVLFSKLTGKDGIVFAFEPEKINYKHLQEVARDIKNIKSINSAVSNTNKPLKIYISNLTNVDHRTYAPKSYESSYQIKSTTIDSFLKGKRVDFVKIDIQGADFLAIRGMKKTLINNPQIIIFTEIWPEGMNMLNLKVEEVAHFFKELGFQIYVLRGDKISTYNNKIKQSYASYKNYDFDNWIITRRKILTQ